MSGLNLSQQVFDNDGALAQTERGFPKEGNRKQGKRWWYLSCNPLNHLQNKEASGWLRIDSTLPKPLGLFD